FFAYAISRGWVDESARTLIAGAASLGLLCAGVWLHEHRGRTDAALAVVGTAVAALFMTVTVASEVYRVIPSSVGLALALGAGAAIGYELRVPTARLRPSSSFLLALNAVVLALAGRFALEQLGDSDLGNLWLVGLAAAHLLAGLFAHRFPRVSGDIRLLV